MKRKATIEELREALNYNPETGIITNRIPRGKCRVGQESGALRDDGYKVLGIKWIQYQYHRVAWALFHGAWPDGEIDHINGIPGDNRICNLREASSSENKQNRRISSVNTSGQKGVSWVANRSKWHARIQIKGKSINLGQYREFNDAVEAYRNAAPKIHGEFANFGWN